MYGEVHFTQLRALGSGFPKKLLSVMFMHAFCRMFRHLHVGQTQMMKETSREDENEDGEDG